MFAPFGLNENILQGVGSITSLFDIRQPESSDPLCESGPDSFSNSIRLIDFENFRSVGKFPEFSPDEDVTVSYEHIDRTTSFIVYISHNWLRDGPHSIDWKGKPHPDNIANQKHKLCVEGIEKSFFMMAPRMAECYIWCDFCCLDQSQDPAKERKRIDKIIGYADCLFTPMFDIEASSKSIRVLKSSDYNAFNDYPCAMWKTSPHSYMNSSWCRLEMFLSANVPLVGDKVRHEKFDGGLALNTRYGRRPHILYGSLEAKTNRPPIILPPLQNERYAEFDPEQGTVAVDSDRIIIAQVVGRLKKMMKPIMPTYEGAQLADGRPNGIGRRVYPSGAVYEGNWKGGKTEFEPLYAVR